MSDNKKIKVMHIAQSAGGVERYLKSMLRYFDNTRFENILVCSQDYNVSEFENIVNACEVINFNREISLRDINVTFQIRKLIKKYKPDIVYAHSSKAGAVARMADIGMKSKCIYNPHGWAFNMKCSARKIRILTFLEKVMAPFCSKIVCISEYEKKSALKRKICRDEKIKVILNGIEIHVPQMEGTVKRSDLGIPENAYVVGMVGRISSQKSPDIFIRAAELIKREIPEAFFVIIGDGEQRKETEAYAKEHNFADSLIITGWIDAPEKYLNVFDTAMLLSRWEGFGLVLPEYMLAKKPVVATAVDAIPEIIKDDYNGILVEPENFQMAADAAIRLYKCPDLAPKYVTNGFQYARVHFDIKRVARETEELIMEQFV